MNVFTNSIKIGRLENGPEKMDQIAKMYSKIVLKKLTNENSAIFRTVERNDKKTININGQ